MSLYIVAPNVSLHFCTKVPLPWIKNTTGPCKCRSVGKRVRAEEPEELGFSAPAQRPAQQPRADIAEPQANRVPPESQMSNVSESGGHESASAPRRRTGHEEITDLAYEAADHAQDFAEEIEDAVRPIP